MTERDPSFVPKEKPKEERPSDSENDCNKTEEELVQPQINFNFEQINREKE